MQDATFNQLKGVFVEASATINARLSEELKQSGSKVLERNNVSPTEIVRSVYRYMEKHQAIPACLDVAPTSEDSVYQRRRALLRQFDGFVVEPYEVDCKADRARRIEEKYGDLL